MFRSVLFLWFLLVSGGSFATEHDTLSNILPPRNKTRFVFNFDTRNSFIRGEKVFSLGAKLGIEFHKNWRVGVGVYFMPRPLILDAVPPKNSPTPILPITQTRTLFNYFSVYGEYILFQNKHWEFSAPLALGFGNVQTWDLDSNDFAVRPVRKRKVVLLEPSLSGHYRFFSWVGIGAGLGYRRIIATEGHLDILDNRFTRNFDSTFWNVRIKLFPSEIYNVLKGRQRWTD
jgi:hypothetical protein